MNIEDRADGLVKIKDRTLFNKSVESMAKTLFKEGFLPEEISYAIGKWTNHIIFHTRFED